MRFDWVTWMIWLTGLIIFVIWIVFPLKEFIRLIRDKIKRQKSG